MVTKIQYGDGSVTYSTFDESSDDVLRLNFAPGSILVQGKPLRMLSKLDGEGYSFDEKTHVLRIRHEHGRDVDIQGQGNGKPPKYIRFDNPHIAAGSTLELQYPSGLIDWGGDAWMIHAPAGKFGSFCLGLKDPKQTQASFAFPVPTVFAGIDAYNGGSKTATIRFRSPELREKSYTLEPGQLIRIRTGWRDPSSMIEWDFENGEGLLFDNLAYSD